MTFAETYAAAFDAYLAEPSEQTLDAAYALGRDAVSAGLSLLELGALHHDVLIATLAQRPGEIERVGAAAGEFFVEGVSAFEMVRRGFHEAQAVAAAEKRQAEMLRRLSAFLTDASLTVDGPAAIDEILHLVADHARELAQSSWCIVALEGDAPAAAVSVADPSTTVEAETARKLAAGTPATCASGEELASDPTAVALARLFGLDRAPNGRLAVALTALDGHPLGWIQVYDRADGAFGEIDEATIHHLAQMAAASVERIALYASR